MKWLSLALMLAAMAGPRIHGKAAQEFVSSNEQTALIELFTSEGCSSCPPAEAWLRSLKLHPGLWREFVPIAFHVDYWDRLGWCDRFARKQFTDRQYDYAAAWDARSVYTPCFVRNGTEWRDRELKRSRPATTGKLKLEIDASSRVTLSYSKLTDKESAPLEASVALLGAGLESQVRSGENAGRELRHDFVALSLHTVALSQDPSGNWSASIDLPDLESLPATPRAVAAWVTRNGSLEPLQAVGGWLER